MGAAADVSGAGSGISMVAEADSDRIELRGLRVTGVHGVLPEEQDRAQPFEIDLDLVLAHRRAATSDDLADTADYGAAVATAAGAVTGRRHRLLESLAAAIADGVLADPSIAAVTVTVRKLRPPVPYELASAGVRLTRVRS